MSTETPIENIKKAVIFALISVFAFSLMNVPVKTLSNEYSLVQLIFFRSGFALIPVLYMFWHDKAWEHLKTNNLSGHFTRAAVGFFAMFLNFWSFALLPLADATAIHFATPIILTALSVPLLSEKVGPWRWGGVIIGFIGVLIMIQPGSYGALNQNNLGLTIALFGAFMTALAMVIVKRMGRTEHSLTIVFYFTIFCFLFSAIALPFFWVTPSGEDLLLFIILGILGGLGQIFVTKAYKAGPAAFISPFSYLSIIIASITGFMFFGDVPTWTVIIGSFIIISSGLFILYREHTKHKAIARMGIYTMQPARPTEADKNQKENLDK